MTFDASRADIVSIEVLRPIFLITNLSAAHMSRKPEKNTRNASTPFRGSALLLSTGKNIRNVTYPKNSDAAIKIERLYSF